MQMRCVLTAILILENAACLCSCVDVKVVFDSCDLEESQDLNNEIYIIKGTRFGLFNIFSRLQVVVQSSKQAVVYLKTSKNDLLKLLRVKKDGLLSRSIQWFTRLADGVNTYGNKTKHECSPFANQYIALPSEEDNKFTISCDHQSFDLKLLTLFVIGLFLFFSAEHCSRNTAFYYASGVTIGVLMSWTVVIILLLKLLPHKKILFVAVASGASFGLYLTQSFLSNLHFYATYHLNWLLWYTAVVGFSTLAFLYYKGPPSNQRFLNLTKWGMQFLGILLIYNCTWAKEVAVTAILAIIGLHFGLQYFDIAHTIQNWILRLSPYSNTEGHRKRSFLTEEEFREEALKETARALEELRGYCSSPECHPWRMVSRLKDPKRFASFIETGSALSDNEVAEYDKYEPEDGEDSWISTDDLEARNENVEEESSEDELLVSDDLDGIDIETDK